MNTKKKFLSFALACLILAMTFSAAVPVFAADAVCKIGDTEYTSFSDALTAAVAGDVVELLKDIEVDKIRTSNTNAFTVRSAIVSSGKTVNAKITLKTDSIVSNGSTNANKITFENIDFIQPSTNPNSVINGRGGSVYTFNNCQSSAGATIYMNDCAITYIGSDTTNAMFASFNDMYKSVINLNNVSVTAPSTKTMFRLCSKMTVNIMGDTTLDNNGGTLFAEGTKNKGGTVNIYNGVTYGAYTAPALEKGASIRISSKGLRFSLANASDLSSATEYGMLFAKSSDSLNNSTFIPADTNSGLVAAENGKTKMVLVGDNAGITTEYAARAYAQYTDCGGATITVYSSFNAEDNVRSMSGIANYIVDNDASSYETAAIDSIKSVYGIQ